MAMSDSLTRLNKPTPKMHITLLISMLAVLVLLGQTSTPASAQIFEGTPEGVYEVADPDAPLSLLQSQAVAEVREKDRHLYMIIARLVKIYRKKYYSPKHRLIKPIAEWTQRDLWVFRQQYDKLFIPGTENGLEKWSALELAILVDTIASDSGGDDGDGDE
jgi:hypothetical protein